MLNWLISFWILRPLWHGFFGIGQGPTGQEKQMYDLTAGIGKFGTSQGEADTLKSQNFWSAIMSGDPTQVAKVLGPEMSTMNRQAQQQKKTASEFGTRSGGTTATMNALDTTTLADVRRMIASLTGSAAGNLGSMGSNLLSTGLSGASSAFSDAATIQQQNAAKWNDIFSSIGTVAGAGIGALSGGGWQNILRGAVIGQGIGTA